jgi:hypothetical protein
VTEGRISDSVIRRDDHGVGGLRPTGYVPRLLIGAVERVGWVERSDTHHVLDDGDGLREVLNPSYNLLPDGLFGCPTGKSPKVCPVLGAKIFRFPRRANHLYKLAPSRPTEGRLAIVTDAGRDAVDAGGAADERAWLADGEVVWS